MAKEIKLPKLSEDADEGTVAELMIEKGDTIEKDDSIIAVESDKATVEVPSEEAGTVKEVKVKEGDAIKTGDVIAVLEDAEGGEEDEEKEEKPKEDEETDEKPEEDNDEDSDQEEEQKSEKKDEFDEGEETEESEEEKESSESEEVYAAPGAKRLAREHDVNLKDIEGNGPEGLITTGDVQKAAGVEGSKEVGGQGAELPDFSQWGTVERKSLSEMKKATANQTQSSWQTVPHVTQFDEADVSGIEEYIEQYQAEVEEQGGKLTITAVLTKVIANALHQFPKFNASIDMDAGEVILKKYVHIGIAVDTDEGLLVPIMRDVDQKSIIELATEITGLAEKARNKDLSSEVMKGGNFIISNLGGIGGTQFTPIIFHPQVAILGVSEMTTTPVYNKETKSFQPVLTLPLSLSYDHRLINGAEGARFLRYVCNALEDPYKALLGE